jgi:predicted DNA-binding transcriptional regulator YafY
MARAQRLLDTLQLLRQYRYPVKGARLASKLNVSLRTLYRDIKTLQQQGAPIEGEAGLGYILQPGYMLPPLMFADEEIEAMVLGMRWVAKKGDQQLKEAARSALSKVAAVLPRDLRHQLENSSLLVGPNEILTSAHVDLALIRQTIRAQHKAAITYRDLKGVQSKRTIWPFALAFFDGVRVIVAWCEPRQGFRHFRYDRIQSFTSLNIRYPKTRQSLLKEWRQTEGIPSPDL